MLKFLANIKSNLDSVGKTLGSEFSSKPLQKTICYHLIKLSKPSIECHNSNLEHMINRNVCTLSSLADQGERTVLRNPHPGGSRGSGVCAIRGPPSPPGLSVELDSLIQD